MLHANFERGYYVVDASDNVGAGPFETPEGAEEYITNSEETVMYFSGGSCNWAEEAFYEAQIEVDDRFDEPEQEF